MRYNVLNKSEDQARSDLKKHKTLCIMIGVIVLAINILLTLFTTDATFTAFLIINILIDIVAGVYIFTYYLANIRTQKKLIAIFSKTKEEIKGTIEDISSDTLTHLSIDCVKVKVSERILFLPIGTIELTCGENIIAYCSSNVIVEVEKC